MVEAEQAIQKGDGEKILFVDDYLAVLTLTKAALAADGFAVSAFLNPEEALADFTKKPDFFDILVTDFDMPEMSGIELARAIRKIREEIPIIVCSAACWANVELENSGLKNYLLLEKPFDPEKLTSSIRKMLAEVAAVAEEKKKTN